jgi:hypothetical protein
MVVDFVSTETQQPQQKQMDNTNNLEKLVNSKLRFNEFINVTELSLHTYIRKTTRFYQKEAKMVETLEIGSIEVEESQRRRGHFKTFLNNFEKLAGERNRMVFVECVHNPFLQHYLKEKGYEEDCSDPSCYWRKINL